MSTLATPSELRERAAAGQKYMPDIHAAPLDAQELAQAVEGLRVSVPAALYRMVERAYCDPPITNQKFALVSFVPSTKAQPDPDGMFGMMKVRGVFATEDEADAHAEKLIKDVDSRHTILTTFVGRPFPIIEGGAVKYGASLKEIKVQEGVSQILKDDDTDRERQETKVRKELEKRKAALTADVVAHESLDADELEERYTHLRVKRAQLAVALGDIAKRLVELKAVAWKTHDELQQLDTTNPTLESAYRKRYEEARAQCGLDNSTTDPMMAMLDLDETQMVEIFGLR